ncbi:AraC family transcriptional regulator [Pseudomonas knackmussii B13]|uniref:AraC family transcriptional regulator n=1 Tax=Pseudomonas knackmussii (strain DSM 6978 / CCUG 54928 / LMG 23759 / B13) TaxID=1301098 RepID=A0A024HHW5_PSEKB|nr:AraC family transcriptional regulator [Pseudomonas knackmussii]CDF84491.1 AraC family transcriptional regulator [Pseudomonas knackmussii B13]
MTDYARASGLHGLPGYAASQSLNAQDLLRDAGLPGDLLEHPESLVAYRKMARVVELGAQRSGNPLFGLELGLQQSIAGTIGPLLYLARNSRDVGEALREIGRYFHVHASAARIRLEVQGDLALFHYDPVEAEEVASSRPIVELVLGGGLQLMRLLLGNRWQPRALLLQHAPVKNPQSYSRLLGLVPQFNAPINAWVFDARLLDIPLSSADPELKRLVRQHLDTLGQASVEDLPNHVQQIIRNFLPQGRVAIEQVANYLSLSSRTLQRYLAEEDTSFNLILDQTRKAMASRYLNDSEINLTQLAEILGYSELSAFSRAFNRWFGVSPREWKKRQGQGKSRRLIGQIQRKAR